MRFSSAVVGLIAAVTSIGAGLYLVTSNSATIDVGAGVSGQSWLEVIAHGIGAYFIARGLWMIAELLHEDESSRA